MGEFAPAVRELLCQRCGKEYPVWFVANEIWNAVCRGGDTSARDVADFLCLTCFAMMAEAAGIVPTAWELKLEQDDKEGE